MDTVTISLKEYNRLRDFEKCIMDGGVVIRSFGMYQSTEYVTESDAVRVLKENYEKDLEFLRSFYNDVIDSNQKQTVKKKRFKIF